MKPLLNTLFITQEDAYLSRDGECVKVKIGDEVKLRVPVHTLAGIVTFGRTGASPALMRLCAESNVNLSFLTSHGRFLARIQGPTSGNVLLRREQYRRTDDDIGCAAIAQSCVIAKIANARVVLLRAARERPDGDGASEMKRVSNEMGRLLRSLEQPHPLGNLRGIEGDAGRLHFSVFNHLITAPGDDFRYTKRSRRPPLDPINAILSFLYTLLVHDCVGALETVGLDPQVGYLHRERPGRPSLALDLMEELRPVLADRLALTLINRQQIRGKGFTKAESGAVIMDDATRKKVLVAWQERKREEITHPFLGEKIAIGLLPHVQALLMARHLRGDLDGYPPFLWR